ncbi:AMP-binding protein [Xanthomonas bonasiae]|uniref:AMP-binding protein n=1 Tax=Xanthomonas bonasiae TaxID=2810351 RepID=UPI001784865D|nr:AMP-binding protein [Xanthomonas surreyensis]MBD7921262.1 AMP-binding protein [Xanthomonas surreyensis]
MSGPGFAEVLGQLRGDQERLLTGHGAIREGELADRIRALADALQRHDLHCVASRLDNGSDWLALDLAIRLRGGVHVPLPTFFSEAQARYALHSSGAQCLVAGAGMPAPAQGVPLHLPLSAPGLACWRLAPMPVALPAGTGCITYTSGTTGQPKGVCLEAGALLQVAASLADAASALAPRRHLCLMPLSTLLENVAGVYATLLSGAQIAVPSLAEIGYSGAAGLDIPTLIACLHRYQPHSVILVPQLLLALVMAAEQGVALPASLRYLAVGGGRVGPGLLRRAAALRLPVFEGYGLTECASVVALNRPEAQRAGSVGRALPHARVSAIDGELWVDGVRCLGYLGAEGPPAGAIATGDLGHVDDEGFVHVTGRRKHVFITAYGRNVSPEWVESELLQHPHIAQAVVCGEARAHNLAVLWPRNPALDDAAIARALAEVNAGLPDYARVSGFVRASAPFTAADGLLTGNGRPRRDAILQRHADAIAQRYAELEPLSSHGASR